MRNITLAIDENILKIAKKIAVEKNTTLNQLVRGYLRKLVSQERFSKEKVIRALKSHYKETACHIGKLSWKREDLYER